MNPERKTMVHGKYSFQDLVDLDQLRGLFKRFSLTTRFTTGLFSYPNQELLIGTGWRDICTKFHRASHASEVHCKRSDLELTSHLKERGALNISHCENGLVHGAAPIVIKGVHIASLFTGQVLFKEPDIDFFRKQGQAYGYDLDAYLEAVQEVPVVTEEAFKQGASFLSEMAALLAEQGLIEIRSREKTQAVQESKKLLQDVFDGIQDGISVLDPNLTITRVNKWMEKTHHEDMPLVGKKCYEAYQKRKTVCPWCPSVKALSTRRVHVEDVRVPSDEGSLYWCELSAYPLRDENDDVVGVIEHVKDITERKQAEQALRESEYKYSQLVQESPDAIISLDNTGRFLSFNPVAERVSGFSAEEVIGRMFFEIDILTKESIPVALREFQLVTTGEERLPFELTIRHKDNSHVFMEANPRLITQEGQQPWIQVTFRDITYRKRAEEERGRLVAQLQQAQKMEAIGTLAGGIAHDFNNILAALIGYTELSLEETQEGTSLQQNLKEILVSGNRAKDLVKQILAFSRQTEQESRPVKVGLIVKEALMLLRASLPTTIEIRQDTQSDSAVLADPTHIHQVLMNLCANAGQAMEEKAGTLDVKLTDVELGPDFMVKHPGTRPGPYIKLTVSDTGRGMPPDLLGRIFDPYFSTKGPGEGTGLGLSVVHGIVRSCGGAITAYSEPGKGSTFNVYLPVIETKEEPETWSERRVPRGTERILFIDDEEILANMGKRVLESLGYDVTARTNGMEALELFKEQPDRFDLVITDMTMPKITGAQLAKELMETRPSIPIILCTGFSARMDEEKAKTTGIKAFVLKPALKEEIAKTVRQVLDSQEEKAEHPTARILVIDDDIGIRAMLRRLLEGAGYDVAEASDGRQGIRLYRQDPADLVITDLIMPEKEGLETIRELRRDFPHVKILAISGGGRVSPDEYLHMAKSFGAKRTLAKPFDPKELLEVVHELISSTAPQEN
ncbi:MAG: response regulator [Thermodesulfobacteriota bacterium]|nr:response regulator [Thermodesulfobacteriota bacterium]